MVIRADSEKIKEEIINFDSQISFLDDEINNINKSFDLIKNVWIGTDCDIFMDNSESYMKSVKKMSEVLKEYKYAIEKSNNIYIESDKAFSEKIERNEDIINS